MSFTTSEAIGLVADGVSFVLAVIAIWMALHHKSEGDRTNRHTSDLLNAVKEEVNAVRSQVAVMQGIIATELSKSGDAVRIMALQRTITTSTGALSTTAAGDLAASLEGPPNPSQSPPGAGGASAH